MAVGVQRARPVDFKLEAFVGPRVVDVDRDSVREPIPAQETSTRRWRGHRSLRRAVRASAGPRGDEDPADQRVRQTNRDRAWTRVDGLVFLHVPLLTMYFRRRSVASHPQLFCRDQRLLANAPWRQMHAAERRCGSVSRSGGRRPRPDRASLLDRERGQRRGVPRRAWIRARLSSVRSSAADRVRGCVRFPHTAFRSRR
jgi:hypothetical protein